MASRLRRERHSVTDLKIHLVCVTKYRRAVFKAVLEGRGLCPVFSVIGH